MNQKQEESQKKTFQHNFIILTPLSRKFTKDPYFYHSRIIILIPRKKAEISHRKPIHYQYQSSTSAVP